MVAGGGNYKFTIIPGLFTCILFKINELKQTVANTPNPP